MRGIIGPREGHYARVAHALRADGLTFCSQRPFPNGSWGMSRDIPVLHIDCPECLAAFGALPATEPDTE